MGVSWRHHLHSLLPGKKKQTYLMHFHKLITAPRFLYLFSTHKNLWLILQCWGYCTIVTKYLNYANGSCCQVNSTQLSEPLLLPATFSHDKAGICIAIFWWLPSASTSQGGKGVKCHLKKVGEWWSTVILCLIFELKFRIMTWAKRVWKKIILTGKINGSRNWNWFNWPHKA